MSRLTRGLVLGRGTGPPIRRPPVEGAPLGMTPGCWQLMRWPAVADEQPRRPDRVR
jgi:hypothetical protein